MSNVSPHSDVGIPAGKGRRNRLNIGSWNVEGLTDIKLYEICMYMQANSVDIFCIQETRKPLSDNFISDLGYHVYLSGGCGASREWAGVGFIISPAVAHQIAGVTPVSNRVACLKMTVAGGYLSLLSAYAPHNLKPLPERLQFYDELDSSFDRHSRSGHALVFGDFNARIGQRRAGEEDILGEHCFGREAVHVVEAPNRDLLIEFCTSKACVVSNTMQQAPPHNKVTYHEPAVPPTHPITCQHFSMLDLLLVPSYFGSRVLSIGSDLAGSIASHHFPVTAIVEAGVDRSVSKAGAKRRDWAALKCPQVRSTFISLAASAPTVAASNVCIDTQWDVMRTSIVTAAEAVVPLKASTKRKPWISDGTLALIDERTKARLDGDWQMEKNLRKHVHRSARRDRANWLERVAGSGEWDAMRVLRKPRRVKQSRLKDANGVAVGTDERATTLAAHLENVQWCVRPVTLLPDLVEAKLPPLPVNEGLFTYDELCKAIARLPSGKATREGDVPVECFKALVDDTGEALQPFLDLCNTCLAHHAVPGEWLKARIAMIFKKGDPAACDNYRPISLLAIAYKLFAAMIKQRLLAAGADNRLWRSQFGFRTKRSTEDAIYVVRRRIELAVAQRSGQVSIVALDWRKAFDRVDVPRLLGALGRFGLPASMVNMIGALMRDRQFFVEDFGHASDARPQRTGISQGCTLSPLLFVILMTMLMRDAVALLSPEAKVSYDRGDLADIVYADDTLLLGVSAPFVTEFINAVETAGKQYGLELHYGKLQLLQVGCDSSVHQPDGQCLERRAEMSYLGTVLNEHGYISSELNRRIGCAKSDFTALAKVWNHATVSRSRKVRLYSSLIESKLLYSLVCTCPTKADLRRLDGFQAKCIRKIWGIPPAYYSRVSNAKVLQLAHCSKASELLMRRQLVLFGKVVRAPQDHPLRASSLIGNTWQPATSQYVRKVGRPRKEWITTVSREAFKRFGPMHVVAPMTQNAAGWKQKVHEC